MIRHGDFWWGVLSGAFGPILLLLILVLIRAICISWKWAVRDTMKWVNQPVRPPYGNWRKVYLIPQLFFTLLWCHFTNTYQTEYSPVDD